MRKAASYIETACDEEQYKHRYCPKDKLAIPRPNERRKKRNVTTNVSQHPRGDSAVTLMYPRTHGPLHTQISTEPHNGTHNKELNQGKHLVYIIHTNLLLVKFLNCSLHLRILTCFFELFNIKFHINFRINSIF